MTRETILIGSRGSQLALYQAELVKSKLEREMSMITVKIVVIKTSGDSVRNDSHNPLETKRMFTREIEDSLLRKEIDMAVHSAKDMAVVFPDGLKIGAVLEREDVRDCLVSKRKAKLKELPIGARVGTSSLRRQRQLFRWTQDLVIENVRGNVDTRIRKVEEGDYDAVVLALAGIKRLGLEDHVADILPETEFYPAPGQGTILVQSRIGDSEVDELLKPLNHDVSAIELECERGFLKRLDGGCQLPCGMYTQVEGAVIRAYGALYSVENRDIAEFSTERSIQDPTAAGVELAEKLLGNGGQKILDEIRRKYGG